MVQMQDVLGLGSEARMNTPGTVGPQNWTWRMDEGALTPELAARLRSRHRVRRPSAVDLS